MTGSKRVGDLEIEEDLEFQRWSWSVQRVAWVGMALIMTAALLGVFGTGPVSKTTAQDGAGTLVIEHQRFARYKTSGSLSAQMEPAAIRDGKVRFAISQSYLEAMQMSQVIPPPAAVEVVGDNRVYTFLAGDAGRAVAIEFQFEPARIGPINGRMGIADGATVAVNQFVYP